jgi:hypothetical protein
MELVGTSTLKDLDFSTQYNWTFQQTNKLINNFYNDLYIVKFTNMQITERKKWVLVTGGTGFLGAHCILQLLEKG